MIRRIILILITVLLITSCAGAPAATEAHPATEAPATEPAATEPPAFQSLEAPTRQPSVVDTSTPIPAPTQIISTSTETPLPTLELPTEVVNPPARMVWDGTPTYPGDSTPGFAFRVSYDPEFWAVTTDQFGFPALAHRNISGCVISTTSGRGLPATTTVDHEMLRFDTVAYDVATVSENGVKKFVTYTGGDGTVITGFIVDFVEDEETCLAAAVGVLSTLTSVPVSQATPEP
ncbi:MAG: hypothetical protein L0287_28160 [Anaerolineae bacterium]|nr:hypothetical protein [Anaerolineae bacterium]MCI0607641.1 hypothetical protein [Anaerolineae bacterium]